MLIRNLIFNLDFPNIDNWIPNYNIYFVKIIYFYREASELKNSGQTLIWWYCDECSKGIQENEPHFDCMTCGDFTLCKQCKENTEHQHSLRKTFVPEGCKVFFIKY